MYTAWLLLTGKSFADELKIVRTDMKPYINQCYVSFQPAIRLKAHPVYQPVFPRAELTSSAESTGRCRNKNNNSQYSRGQPPVDGFDLSDPVNAGTGTKPIFSSGGNTCVIRAGKVPTQRSFAGGHGTMGFPITVDAQRIIQVKCMKVMDCSSRLPRPAGIG